MLDGPTSSLHLPTDPNQIAFTGGNMATQHSTSVLHPVFQQILDNVVNAQIRQIDRAFRQSLPACEYEHPEYGMCGRIAKVTDLDSERPMCGLHFHLIQIEDQVAELSA
jgi:hypothetical protein